LAEINLKANITNTIVNWVSIGFFRLVAYAPSRTSGCQ